MQSKISSFFKPSTQQEQDVLRFTDDTNASMPSKVQEIRVIYSRRTPKCNLSEDIRNYDLDDKREEDLQPIGSCSKSEDQECFFSYSMDTLEKSAPVRKVLNKKRNYAQFHLELGQSDFLLHSCSICGLKYARGDAEDERVHKEFHKIFSFGVQFKGWCNERVVSLISSDGDRIILVLYGDLPAHWHKVEEVVKIIEKELGTPDGWLLHELCKVYLFISRQRVVGCLVTEPIRSAHRVISSAYNQQNSDVANCKKRKSNPTILQFGSINFRQEVIKKLPSSEVSDRSDMVDEGTIRYEKEAVPATCGIRVIWVLPSSRRKRVATLLLDAMRKSFCKGYVLESSQCAFSQPTSSGKALAMRYCGTGSFLIYLTGTQCL